MTGHVVPRTDNGVLVDVTNTHAAGLGRKTEVSAKVGLSWHSEACKTAAPTEILFDISRQTSALPVTAEDPDWAFEDYGDRYADYSSDLDDEIMAIVDDAGLPDPQCVSEYTEDIYGKLDRDERSRKAPHPTYMISQPELHASDRDSIVDWLVGVQMKYQLKTETLFLAVSILDRFLSTRQIRSEDLQLVACTALFIAAKFEEINPPEVRDFVFITNFECKKEGILAMEVRMLTALEFCLCRPTVAHYLQRYRRESLCSQPHASLLQYILELALLDLRMIRFSPSMQAAAASLVSSRVLKLNLGWPEAIAGRTDRVESVVQCCAEEMCTLLRDSRLKEGEVRRKFSSPEFHCVATAAYSAM
jgi:cyclin B